MKNAKFSKFLSSAKIQKLITSSNHENGIYFINCDVASLAELLKDLKENEKSRFKVLLSICGADYPNHPKRFEVVYNLLSVELNIRCIVKVNVSEGEFVPSMHELYMSALWYERETYDMYGILFKGNPDLRRILTDYDFDGYPLRKDFPLTGYTEVRYDTELKKVVQEPVSLNQEFRNFDFLSPWEGTNYILPGDEKATKDKK